MIEKIKKKKEKSKNDEEMLKPVQHDKEPQTMEELLSQTGYTLRGYKRGDVVSGTVISLSPSEILIDIGFKSSGIVSEREMPLIKDLLPNLKIGDKITVQIVSPESEIGQIILSVKRAGLDKKWKEAKEKLDKEETVEVLGLEAGRSGLLVDWQGLRGFIPASQLDAERIGAALGAKIKAQLIEVDRTANRLVFSEKRVSSPEKLAKKQLALSKFKIGETYEGKVTGIVAFGIFVGLEGCEGLVHISEIAWEKVQNPNDYFKTGDKVKVMVISKEETSGKLNLSIKQLTKDPWQELVKKYTPEQQISGKVMKMTGFGAFVQIEKGVDGLIHISKLPAGMELKEKQTVTCVIEAIDFQKRKISLGLVLTEKPVGYK